jgi:HEAT repeat protein
MDEESDKIAALVESLDRRDKKEMRRAAEALIAYGKTAPRLADRLHALIEVTPAEKRWPIAYVLAQVSPLTTTCLKALDDALDAADPDIRWAVALLLARLGKNSDSGVVAHLVELLKSGRPTQRRMAVYCLRDIGAHDSPSTEAFQTALVDPDPLVRVAAITSLRALPEIARGALDRLLRLVSADEDSRVRASAALSLSYPNAPTEEIRQALDNASRSDDPKLAKAARAALEIVEKK